MAIYIFGNGDVSEDKGFATEADFIKYVNGGIFNDKYKGIYRYSQAKPANIIVLSRKGFAFGYFDISRTDKPTTEDELQAKNPRKVYLVKEAVAFEKSVQLLSLNLRVNSFGLKITQEQFEQIRVLAGKETRYINNRNQNL